MANIPSCILIVLIDTTASIMGKYLNDKPTAMVNEFLISKWKLYYKDLDTNHDGKLSIEDAKLTVNKFTESEHLEAEKGKMVKEAFLKWWDECVFRGRTSDILEQDFVNALSTNFKADQEEFNKEIGECYEEAFAAINVDGDKYVSKEELMPLYEAFGHQNIAKANDFFKAFNPEDGLVPYRVVVDSWVDFLTSADESKGNMIKNGFDVYGFE